MNTTTHNYFINNRLWIFKYVNGVLAAMMWLFFLNLSSCTKDIKQQLESKSLVKTIESYSTTGELTGRTRIFYNSNNYETLRLTYTVDPSTNVETPSSKLEIRISNDTVYRLFYLYKTNVSDYVLNSANAYLQDANGFTQKQLRLTVSSPNLMPIISTSTFIRTVINKDKVEYVQSSSRKFVVDKSQKTVTTINYIASVEANRTTNYYDCFDGPSFEKLPTSYNFQKEFGKGLLVLKREVFEDFENPANNFEKNSVISKDSEGRVSEVVLSTGARNKYFY